jgi:hypothetical protein
MGEAVPHALAEPETPELVAMRLSSTATLQAGNWPGLRQSQVSLADAPAVKARKRMAARMVAGLVS